VSLPFQPASGPGRWFEVTTEEFPDKVIASPWPVVVCFRHPAHPDSRAFSGVLGELVERYAGRVVFALVDAEAGRPLLAAFGVGSLPALIFFKDGYPLEMIQGPQPAARLCHWIDGLRHRPAGGPGC